MIRPLKMIAVAATALLAANAVQAASLSYAYSLQPGGTLDFTLDGTALNSQGYGTVDSSQGLQSWSLQVDGQTFTAAEDPFYPSEPNVTLVNSALSFAVFAPTNSAGVSYDFYANGRRVRLHVHRIGRHLALRCCFSNPG